MVTGWRCVDFVQVGKEQTTERDLRLTDSAVLGPNRAPRRFEIAAGIQKNCNVRHRGIIRRFREEQLQGFARQHLADVQCGPVGGLSQQCDRLVGLALIGQPNKGAAFGGDLLGGYGGAKKSSDRGCEGQGTAVGIERCLGMFGRM